MIPEAKKTAVQHALQVAFGVSECEDISQQTAGLSSALIFRIVVLGKPYLLRVITSTHAINDPTHYYACMEAAAKAGLAPHIWYAGIADRISITDFVEAKPFPMSVARLKLPYTLKRLHSLLPFPFRVNYLDFIDSSMRKFQDAKALPANITDELFRQYERIKTVYPRNDRDHVSCHNDLKPDNIIFDGERVWLVDWEAAFLNDRYVDLAVIANFIVTACDDEMDYLKRYFEEEVTDYHQARFFLMRQLIHMIYFTFLMSLSIADGTPIDLNMPKPGFREFHDRLWEGNINLGNHNAQQQYAWVHMAQLLHNVQQKRFDDSLFIVSSYQLL